jgi:hypothetical protein
MLRDVRDVLLMVPPVLVKVAPESILRVPSLFTVPVFVNPLEASTVKVAPLLIVLVPDRCLVPARNG